MYNPKIKIIYFAYLLPTKWESIVLEQLEELKQLDLYNIADEISINVNTNEEELQKLKIILSEKYDKIKIGEVSYENVFEYTGFKKLYDVAQSSDDNDILLYFHTKGMTGIPSNNARKKLFDLTIKNFAHAIESFKNDSKLMLYCALPSIYGFAYYNFFFAKAEYIKNCEIPEIKESRHFWETYIAHDIKGKYKYPKMFGTINNIYIKRSSEIAEILNKI